LLNGTVRSLKGPRYFVGYSLTSYNSFMQRNSEIVGYRFVIKESLRLFHLGTKENNVDLM